jgi:MSHA biogenesis protein MshN
MSVINQVLNQLEQRGAHTSAEQTMVRAVPQARRNFSLPLLAFGLVLVAGVAVWQWTHTRKPDAAASAAPKSMQGQPQPAVAGNNPGAPEPGLLTPQHQAAEIGVPLSGVPAANMPASQLSFELSMVPLPPAIPHASAKPAGKPVQKAARKKVEKAVRIPPIKTSNAEVVVSMPDGAMPLKQISPEQQADAEYRKASALLQQGRIADAISGYEAALRLDEVHDEARQALVALLLQSKRGKDAERVLQEGLKSEPDHTGFTMMLARLQVERGAVAEATATLEKALPYGNSQADYQAFLAALLQRQNRNDEAIAHYQVALQLAPNNGIWLMGYGISLQALKRNADAKVAFQHALDTRTLNPDLQAFVRQKLKAL